MKPTRISIRTSNKNRSLVNDLKKLAKADNRTLNNYIELVLVKHVEFKNQFKTPTP